MMEKTLKEGLTKLGLSLPAERQQKRCAFARAMLRQNEVMNVTGISEEAQVAKGRGMVRLRVLW